MLKRMFLSEKKPYFMGVAIATLLCGAALFGIALSELAANLWWGVGFTQVFAKLVGGLVVTSLGYIHMELEMLRIK